MSDENGKMKHLYGTYARPDIDDSKVEFMVFLILDCVS